MAWKMKGVWYESCAEQGQCAHYFGRDREEPCKSFQVFQIKEGQIDDVDISGVVFIILVDFFSPKFADMMVKGGDGAIYISDTATEEQRKALENHLLNQAPGNMLLKQCHGVKVVKIDLNQEGNTYHITMPHGELKLTLTVGLDGVNPVRLDNCIFSVMLPNIKICHTHFWKYNDFGKNLDFVNRGGTIADFEMQGG